MPKLGTPIGSVATMVLPGKTDTVTASDPATTVSDPAAATLVHFLVDMKGLAFWPLCFLPFTAGYPFWRRFW